MRETFATTNADVWTRFTFIRPNGVRFHRVRDDRTLCGLRLDAVAEWHRFTGTVPVLQECRRCAKKASMT